MLYGVLEYWTIGLLLLFGVSEYRTVVVVVVVVVVVWSIGI